MRAHAQVNGAGTPLVANFSDGTSAHLPSPAAFAASSNLLLASVSRKPSTWCLLLRRSFDKSHGSVFAEFLLAELLRGQLDATSSCHGVRRGFLRSEVGDASHFTCLDFKVGGV